MGIELFRVLRMAAWSKRLYGGEQGFDGFVAEDDEGGYGSEPLGKDWYRAGLADPLDDLFTP